MSKTLSEQIHQSILQAIPDTYEKTVGYPTYDLTKSVALALASQLEQIEYANSQLDVDNLEGDNLTKFVKQRKGTTRKLATKAQGTLTITGTGTISKGDLFSTENQILFQSKETAVITETGTITIEAVEPGTIGNVGAESITQIPKTIQGITEVINTAPTQDGYNEETDQALRERYYQELQEPIATGNEYMFLKLAREVEGVGDAKAQPMHNGPYTMKLYILDQDKQPAPELLINRVQQHLDPLDSWGQGKGELPSGCFTTITAGTALQLNINVAISYIQGYEVEQVKQAITDNITTYLQSIAYKQNYVSYAKIANEINDTQGVLDYENLTVNQDTANIQLDTYEVAILGVIAYE